MHSQAVYALPAEETMPERLQRLEELLVSELRRMEQSVEVAVRRALEEPGISAASSSFAGWSGLSITTPGAGRLVL